MDAQQETGEEGGDRDLWGGEREESERKKTVLIVMGENQVSSKSAFAKS